MESSDVVPARVPLFMSPIGEENLRQIDRVAARRRRPVHLSGDRGTERAHSLSVMRDHGQEQIGLDQRPGRGKARQFSDLINCF